MIEGHLGSHIHKHQKDVAKGEGGKKDGKKRRKK